jgi:hypothetical protein
MLNTLYTITMKNSSLFALLFAVAAFFTACQTPEVESDRVGECKKHDFEVAANYLGGNYFHSLYSENSFNYNIFLSTDGERKIIDSATGMFDLAEDHPLYSFDLYASLPSLELNRAFNVPIGTYSFDAENTLNPGTLAAQYTYKYMLNGYSGDYEETRFTAGTVEVTRDYIEAILIDDKGKTHHIYHTGTAIDNTNNFAFMKDVGPHSTLTYDLQLSFDENSAVVTPYGDYLLIGKDMWEVVIFEPLSNSQFFLNILVPLGTEALVGEFPVAFDWDLPQMVLPGFVSANVAISFWSWYDLYDGDNWIGGAPIVDGKITISNNANSTQHIVVDVKDDAGYTIKAEFDTDLYGVSPLATRNGAISVKRSRSFGLSLPTIKHLPNRK